jgi:cation diffusion facilitator CzcD-associated flavoprotein CzcO
MMLVVEGYFFGVVCSLHIIRNAGFATHIYEAESGLRGIWHWNCYSGACFHTETSLYQLYAPELYESWNEMVEYFDHIADT